MIKTHKTYRLNEMFNNEAITMINRDAKKLSDVIETNYINRIIRPLGLQEIPKYEVERLVMTRENYINMVWNYGLDLICEHPTSVLLDYEPQSDEELKDIIFAKYSHDALRKINQYTKLEDIK